MKSFQTFETVLLIVLAFGTRESVSCWSHNQMLAAMDHQITKQNDSCSRYLANEKTTLPIASCPSNTSYIIAVMCCVSTISPGHLKQYTNLTRVDLSFNILSELPNHLFANNPYLQRIDVASNQLQFVSQYLFAGLQKLQILNLRNNRISQIAPTAFSDCPQLQELNLSGNKIHTFEVLYLHNLKRLYLNGNLFGSWNQQYDRLETLDLSNNKLTTWGNPAFHMLRHLDLSNNLIRSVSENEFDNSRSLRTIHLNRNKISSLDERTFESLCNLELLNLNWNQLELPKFQWFQRVVENNEDGFPTRLLEGNECLCTVESNQFKLFLLHLEKMPLKSKWVKRLQVDCVGTNKDKSLLQVKWLGAPQKEDFFPDTKECPRIQLLPPLPIISELPVDTSGIIAISVVAALILLVAIITTTYCVYRRRKFKNGGNIEASEKTSHGNNSSSQRNNCNQSKSETILARNEMSSFPQDEVIRESGYGNYTASRQPLT